MNIFENPHVLLMKLNQFIPNFPKIQLSLNPLIIGSGNAMNIWIRFDIGKLANGTHNLGKSLRPLIRATNTTILSGRATDEIVQRYTENINDAFCSISISIIKMFISFTQLTCLSNYCQCVLFFGNLSYLCFTINTIKEKNEKLI